MLQFNLVVALIVFAAHVNSKPFVDVIYPGEKYGVNTPNSGLNRSPPSYGRPDYYTPENSFTGRNSRPTFSSPSDGFNIQGSSSSVPTENTTPQTSQPDVNSGTYQIDFAALFATASSPVDPQGSTAVSTTPEATTKIPRRDPTNRIVYTVSCPCMLTNQYKPVCGTDGQTYGNIGVLLCAQKCGSAVKVYLEGSCGRNNGHPGAISLKY